MRNSCIQGMHFGFTGRKSDLFTQPQILRRGEVHGHSLAVEAGLDHARNCFKAETVLGSGSFLI